MIIPVLFLVLVAFAIACPATLAIIRVSRRLGAIDTEPMPGQEKMTRRAIPNTGGIAIVLGFALPMLLGLLAVGLAPGAVTSLVPALAKHIEGIAEVIPDAAVVLVALLGLHALGLADDRRPLGPFIKLGVMLGISLVVVRLTDTRLLTLLDGYVGGAWLSIALTVLWFGVVINAMNFMDNMDGLAGGTATVASAFFLAAALINGQWFIAACLALLLGACLGFLVWNFAPAKIFMGDGGSLALGFLLAFLTTRTTYYDPATAGGWYAVFMPLLVLAVPLYDFVSVTLIRISQGKSPFVGDLQHFSHRLHRRGLSVRQTALVVYGATAITGVGGIALASLQPWQAILIGAQTLLVLGVIALFEYASTPPESKAQKKAQKKL